MTVANAHGLCPPRFEPVRRALEANFEQGLELGARFTAVQEGEVVLDLVGGWADRARTRAFDERTLAPVFSTSKAVAAILVASAVDRGLLDYEQPLAEVWPEFGQAGKERLTLAQVLSHQSGLTGFPEPMDPELWFDWEAICAKLAAMTPFWPPGTAQGYEPQMFGYLAGEAFRRVDRRGMGRALLEDWAQPFGLDMSFGLAPEAAERAAALVKPSGAPDFGELNPATRAAFLTRWTGAPAGDPRWRSMALPSVNLHATAEALARLLNTLACDGVLDGRRVLSSDVVGELTRERTVGQDQVLPFRISWAAGLMRNGDLRVYGPNSEAVGHSGWGGSCAFADPQRRLSAAYVMNKQSTALVGDSRAVALVDALYDSL